MPRLSPLVRWLVARLLAVLAVGSPATSAGAAPPAPERPRLDAFGDPLPQRAIARLGTLRFRQPTRITSVAYSPDGRRLATGGEHDGIRLWDAASGKQLRFYPARGGQGVFYLPFSPDGNELVSSDAETGLQVWDVATGKKTRQLGGEKVALDHPCFSPDGKFLAAAGKGVVRLWEVWRCPEASNYTQRITFAPDGKTLAAGNVSRLRFHERATGGVTHSWGKGLPEFRRGEPIEFGLLVPDLTEVVSLWFSGFVEENTDARILAAATGKERFKFRLRGGMFRGATLSPDGRLLTISYANGSVRLFRLSTGEEVRHLEAEDNAWHGLVFAPDGRSLASLNSKGAVRLLEVASGRQRLSFRPGEACCDGLAFSPDGNTLATWGGDHGAVFLWDALSGRQPGRLEGHRGGITGVSFAPGGKILATASKDTTVLLWDVADLVRRGGRRP